MTYEQIEKSECCDAELRAVCVECLHREPLKQSFIKYLKDEVERCKARIAELKEYPLWNDFVRGQNEELDYQITHLQAQIKELEV